MLQQIAEHPQIRQTLEEATPADIIEQLQIEAAHPERLFHPDTYVFVPGTPDIELLRRAYDAQLELLEELWTDRAEELPMASRYEALILASLRDTETGSADAR